MDDEVLEARLAIMEAKIQALEESYWRLDEKYGWDRFFRKGSRD